MAGGMADGGCRRWGLMAAASTVVLMVVAAATVPLPAGGAASAVAAAPGSTAAVAAAAAASAAAAGTTRRRGGGRGRALQSPGDIYGSGTILINCGGRAWNEWVSDEAYTDLSRSVATTTYTDRSRSVATTTVSESSVGYPVHPLYDTLRLALEGEAFLEFTVPLSAGRRYDAHLLFEGEFFTGNLETLYYELWSDGALLYRSNKLMHSYNTFAVKLMTEGLTIRIFSVGGFAAITGIGLYDLGEIANELAINCGGPAVDGYVTDEPYTNVSRSQTRTYVPIADAADLVRDTVRYTLDGMPLVFNIPLKANYAYEVELQFTEVHHVEDGRRVLYYELLSGGQLLSRSAEFDVWSITGSSTWSYFGYEEVVLPASEAELSIRIVAVKGDPVISAIRLVEGRGPGGPDKGDDDDDDLFGGGMQREGHGWGDGWFYPVTAGAEEVADDGHGHYTAPSNALRYPTELPDNWEQLSWTKRVAARSLWAPQGEPLEFIFMVPIPGPYELILGWHDIAHDAPGLRVMDVSVGVDWEEPTTFVRGLDVFALTGAGPELAVAHLPPRGHYFVVNYRLRVVLTPTVGNAFINALIVRQVPLFPRGSRASRKPLTGGPSVPDNGGATPTPTPMPPSPVTVINIGGPGVNSTNGTIRTVADQDILVGGNPAGTIFEAAPSVAATLPDPVFHTVRWGADLSYEVPVMTPGTYMVAVSSIELVFGPGTRAFGVTIAADGGEPQVLVADVDLVATAGGGKYTPATWVLRQPLTVTSSFTVRAVGTRNAACVAAIQMMRVQPGQSGEGPFVGISRSAAKAGGV